MGICYSAIESYVSPQQHMSNLGCLANTVGWSMKSHVCTLSNSYERTVLNAEQAITFGLNGEQTINKAFTYKPI